MLAPIILFDIFYFCSSLALIKFDKYVCSDTRRSHVFVLYVNIPYSEHQIVARFLSVFTRSIVVPHIGLTARIPTSGPTISDLSLSPMCTCTFPTLNQSRWGGNCRDNHDMLYPHPLRCLRNQHSFIVGYTTNIVLDGTNGRRS